MSSYFEPSYDVESSVNAPTAAQQSGSHTAAAASVPANRYTQQLISQQQQQQQQPTRPRSAVPYYSNNPAAAGNQANQVSQDYYDNEYRNKYYTSAPSSQRASPTYYNQNRFSQQQHQAQQYRYGTMMDEYGSTGGTAAGPNQGAGVPMTAQAADDYHRQTSHHRSRSASRLNRYNNPAAPGYDTSYYDEEGTIGYYNQTGQMSGHHHMGAAHHASQQPVSILNRSRHASGPSVMSRNALPPDGNNYLTELQLQNSDLQRELANLKKELELTNQKLGSSMHSIKTFWSPELKKERALRKEESARYSLLSDQLKLLNSENQKQALLVRQLEEELRLRTLRGGASLEMQRQMEGVITENEHLVREIRILRETIKEFELRVETQKQTLQARDESIKKLLEMLQAKGIGKDEDRAMIQQLQIIAQKQIDELRVEIQKRDQEILSYTAKMKTLEEQQQDYQRHIAVLKESLCAKEEHYNMLQADVEELRGRIEEKNRVIEKKTNTALSAAQERNRMANEFNEMRDQTEIKDRKINVLQRKIENLEDLLKEKDNQVDMARARLSQLQNTTSTTQASVPVCGTVSTHLEESISDKEKQIAQLREQRDRAEHEKVEERDLHDRDVAEYKLKIHGLESDVDKLNVRVDRALSEKERLEARLDQSQLELGKCKAELEKTQTEFGKNSIEFENHRKIVTRLELDIEKLKNENERLCGDLERSQTTFGRNTLNTSQELERLQEKYDKNLSDLRRSQAELRMTQSDYERVNAELTQLQDKIEKSQGEIYRLKAKLENSVVENENLKEELERNSNSYTRVNNEKDKVFFEYEKIKEEFDRNINVIGKYQSQVDKVQKECDKLQETCDRLQEKHDKLVQENRRVCSERDKLSYEIDNFAGQIDKVQAVNSRVQKEKESIQVELDRVVDKLEHNSLLYSRLQKEKDSLVLENNRLVEKIDLLSSQVSKRERDKEVSAGELEVARDRLEKETLRCNKLVSERDHVVSEVNVLRERLDKLLTINKKLEDDKKRIEADFELFREKYERCSTELFRIQAKLDTSNIEVEKINSIVNKLTLDNNKLQDCYDRGVIQSRNWKENEDKLREELDRWRIEAEVAREKLEKHANDIKKDRENKSEEILKLQAEIDRLHTVYGRAAASEARIEEETTRLKYELDQRASNEMQMSNEIKKLRTEVEDLAHEKSCLEKELSKARVTDGETETTSSRELTSLKLKYDRVCEQLSALENIHRGAELKRSQETKDLDKMIDVKEHEIQHLKSVIESKNERISAVEEQLVGSGDVEVLKRDIEHNSRVIEKQNSDYKRLKDEYAKVIDEIKKVQDASSHKVNENSKLRSNFEEKANELAKLKGVLEEKEKEIAARGKENGKLQERLDRYKAQQDKYEKQMSKYEHEMMQLTNERDELVTQLEKSQELLVQFQKELNSRVQNNEENAHEANGLRNKVIEFENEISRLRKVIASEQSRMVELEGEVKKRDKQFEAVKKNSDAEVARLNGLIQALNGNVEALKANLQSASETTSSGSKEVGLLRNELEQLNHKLESVSRLYLEKETECEEVVKMIQERDRNLSNMQSQLNSSKQIIDNLNAQVKEYSAKIKDSDSTVSELTKRLRALEQTQNAPPDVDGIRQDMERTNAEMERLLQLVKMGQDEVNAKDRNIKQLQEQLRVEKQKSSGPASQVQAAAASVLEQHDIVLEQIIAVAEARAGEIQMLEKVVFDISTSGVGRLSEDVKIIRDKHIRRELSNVDAKLAQLELTDRESKHIARLSRDRERLIQMLKNHTSSLD